MDQSLMGGRLAVDARTCTRIRPPVQGHAASDRMDVTAVNRINRASAPGSAGVSLQLDDVLRVAMMASPSSRRSFTEQAREVFAALRGGSVIGPMQGKLTVATVFLAEPTRQSQCEALLREVYGAAAPLVHYVGQAPADGAALAVEAWAIAGPSVCLDRLAPGVGVVEYGGVRWIHVCGIEAAPGRIAREQASQVFYQLQAQLRLAGAGFEDVVRTWLYVGGITAADEDGLRYAGLNAARTGFFDGVRSGGSAVVQGNGHPVYPASTGIGMSGRGLSASCMALQTRRSDVRRVALENPWQTPSCEYAPVYSPQSPKFSRAMAVTLGSYMTTWVSGTASIVDSASVFPGDIERQTHQTLDNIETLIAAKNFARHGLEGCGARLGDLAKVRVYVKRRQDYAQCRAVCEARLPGVPAIYVLAEVCRPELLVEIEGVAFSAVNPTPS